MSYGDRYTSSSYRKIFGGSPRFSDSSSRMGSASPRGSAGLRPMPVSRSSASGLSMYKRMGRSSISFSGMPTGSLDLTQTSVVNNEFKVIRTNEKEQLQVWSDYKKVGNRKLRPLEVVVNLISHPSVNLYTILTYLCVTRCSYSSRVLLILI